jgi:hypothetical protein
MRADKAERPWVEIANAAISAAASSPLPLKETLLFSLSSSSERGPASPFSTAATAAAAKAA